MSHRCCGLTAGYGKMAILHDVPLEVRAGDMVTVIGPGYTMSQFASPYFVLGRRQPSTYTHVRLGLPTIISGLALSRFSLSRLVSRLGSILRGLAWLAT